ncbi:MAG TPA: amino acid permease [Thermoanaerobaculia bacterium]|nr:amino acid permease [Thermoanaerobaculia bacterium]
MTQPPAGDGVPGPSSSAAATAGASTGEPELARRLGTWDAVLITVGSVIGTGIFLTTSDIARELPSATLILGVWVLGGVLTLCGALTYGELGAMFPRAGGIYHFLKEAYGTPVGFLYGWAAFLVIMSGGIAALAVAFGEYFGSFVPWFSTSHLLWEVPLGGGTWRVSGGQVAAAIAILVLTLSNHFGVREGALVQNLLTVVKVGGVGLLVVFGLWAAPGAGAALSSSAAPALAAPAGLLSAVGIAMIAALWTYDGWYGATFSAGEMRDPSRNLPFGLVWGTVLIVALYLGLNVVYLRALPIEEIASSTRIAEDATVALLGPGAGKLVSAMIVVSTLGCLAATLLYSSRIYLPMARDGVFFRSFGVVHPRWRVPTISLWAQSVWAILLTLSGTYEQLYTYVVFAAVAFHALGGMAVIVLRRSRPDLPRPYRVWGYPLVPIVFIGSSLLLVGNTLVERPVEALLGTGLVLLGLPAYAWWRSRPA